jgi:Uma2 family endonuclease
MATIATRIGPADHGRAMSLEEFLEAEEEPGYRCELASGKLEATEVPNDPHGEIVCKFYCALAHYKLSHPDRIHRFGGAGEFRFWLPGMVSGRNPDGAVVLKGAPKDHRNRRLPALAVEVVSVGSEVRDYETKRQEYLAYGLLEYWIIDPQARRVIVLTRRGDVWAEQVFQNDQMAQGLVLPGFHVLVSDLWINTEDESED